MKSVRTRTKACISTLCLSCLVVPTILAANDQNDFDPKQLPLLVTQGDFQSAIVETGHAIAYYGHLVAAEPQPGTATTPEPFTDPKEWHLLNVSLVGHYMCAKAQLLALRGDFVGADKTLSDAKTYASNHPELSGFLMGRGWETTVSATHAFILEKAGKHDEATMAYHSPDTEFGQGRLALLALNAGDYTKARQLALAAGENPTAYFVLGRLEEKDSHKQAAREWYNKALVELQTVKGQFLPIYFCEGLDIANSQKRVGK
jgi:tetratricopeptide (TPR) repeat protein